MSCIFCFIVQGEVPSSKVYEDDQILAFMDIQPVREGQVLVIPKEHIDHFSDIPEELATKIYVTTHRISRAVRESLHPERVGLLVHGYGVPHAHMIICPQHDKDDITSGRMAVIENDKVVFNAENLPVVPRNELNRVAGVIQEHLATEL